MLAVRSRMQPVSCVAAVLLSLGLLLLQPARPQAGEADSSWPEQLAGPFELRDVLHVRVPMSDGVELEGWIGVPDLPDGVPAPTLLSTSPYYG